MDKPVATDGRLVRKGIDSQFQSVKIISTKGGSQDVTHLSLIAIAFQPRNLLRYPKTVARDAGQSNFRIGAWGLCERRTLMVTIHSTMTGLELGRGAMLFTNRHRTSSASRDRDL